MPLSTTGLQEGDFTALRVLKNGQLVDVLTLTAGGSPDLPVGGLSIAQTAGLQSQLNAKASITALTAAAESLGGEIDALDVGVSAVATAVAGLGAAVALKQNLIDDGGLSIAKTADLQRELDDITSIRQGMQATIGGTATSLAYTQQDLSALTLVVNGKADANALSATSAALAAKASQVQLSAVNTTLSTQLNTVSTLLATKASTTALATGLAGKQDLLTDSLTLGGLTVSGGDVAFLQHNNGVAFQNDNAQTFAVFEPAGTTLGRLVVQGELVASNTYNKTQVDELLGTWAFRLPSDALDISKIYDLQRQLTDINAIRAGMQASIGGTAAQLVYTQQDLTALTTVVGGKQGQLDTSSALDVASVACGAGGVTINSGSEDVPFIAGNEDNYLRLKFGRHLDSYNRADNTGETLNFQMHTGSPCRIHSKLSIGLQPNAFQLAVQGATNVTDFCLCPAYRIGSDQRLKDCIQDASLDECTRLLLAVRPKTYVLKSTGQEQCGYIAQNFQQEAQTAFLNSIVGESLDDEKHLCLDYSRVVPILHGALLSALARIEALESRLQ